MTFMFHEDKNRYLAMQDGQEAGHILVSQVGNALVFEHLGVMEEHRGKGVAGQLLQWAMEDVARKGLKVIPVCPYVRDAFDKNPEYRKHQASPRRVGVIAGSLRKQSFSRKLAVQLIHMLPAGYIGEVVEIGDLPMYNQDFDEGQGPESYDRFRQTIAGLDGLIFVTPEYNRGTSAVLKNALDIASRPWGQNQWSGKPSMVIGITPGTLGAMGAVIDVRRYLSFLNSPVMGQPEAYLSGAGDMFSEDGTIASEDTKGFVQSLINAYVRHLEKNLG